MKGETVAAVFRGDPPPSNMPSVSERMDAELLAQGGIIKSLMILSQEIEEALVSAGKVIARGIVHVASDIDIERRGIAAVHPRQDAVEVVRNVEAYVNGALLHDDARAMVVARIIESLTGKVAPVPAEPVKHALAEMVSDILGRKPKPTKRTKRRARR